MRLSDAYNAKAIALTYEQSASNKIPFLGAGFFPAKKKAGLDLKWIKTSKGLPVTLMPSAFDTVSTIRSREGIKIEETEMAYFKESMLLKEVDRQELLRVKESTDPYAQEVIERVYNDAETLIDGANVVPERMIWQLLTPTDGHPAISISADGATYAYNYDPDGSYATNNFTSNASTAMWSDLDDSDPIGDIQYACDRVENLTGTRPVYAVVSRQTMNYIKQNVKVRSAILAQNSTANIFMNDARVKEIFLTEVGITLIVYTKQYKNESGVATKFLADGFCVLLPEGAVGNTYYGTTPDEADLLDNPAFDTAIVNTGVAVTVTDTSDPVNKKTTVSEIVLPSFERMDETYVIYAYH